MEKKIILVKKVLFVDEESRYTVLKADIMEEKIPGKYVPTRNVQTFTGHFFFVDEGDRLAVEVENKEHRFYGTQWRTLNYHRMEPGSLEEVKRFLSTISGLGPAKIKKLLDHFGLDTLKTIRTAPQSMKGLGISEKTIKKVQKKIEDNSCFEEILTFLQINQLNYRYAYPIFKKYGAVALQRMQDNPFALFYDKIIDFKTADGLSYSLGFSATSQDRIEAGTIACLKADSEQNGNLFLPYDKLSSLLQSFFLQTKSAYPQFELSDNAVSQAVDDLIRSRQVITEPIGDTGKLNLYLWENYWAETEIVKALDRLNTGLKRFSYDSKEVEDFFTDYESKSKMILAENQKEAVRTALKSHISIITGGPGTGKTQTVNTMLRAIQTMSPNAVVKLCAPTGKAAQRMKELTNREAKTIHRLLKMGYYQTSLKEEELECDFLVIDEFSMVDCFLCANLFRAISSEARIVIVGDHEQLPSVGPGLVLRDMINSGKIPTTKLSQIFRQGSTSLIIRNAHEMIRAHEEYEPYMLRFNQKANAEFYFMENNLVSNIQKIICKSVQKLLNDYGYKMDEIKVLSPVHGGDLGTESLNLTLQKTFNPNGQAYERMSDHLVFRVGDPVIHLKNDYDLEVFNGETGIVKEIGQTVEQQLLIEYPEQREVWYDLEQVDELDVAYAMTTHKSQGSEFKAVIMPLHESLMAGLNRNLIYTAITRAKKMVILVGSRNALSMGLRRDTIGERKSNLIARLQKLE